MYIEYLVLDSHERSGCLDVYHSEEKIRVDPDNAKDPKIEIFNGVPTVKFKSREDDEIRLFFGGKDSLLRTLITIGGNDNRNHLMYLYNDNRDMNDFDLPQPEIDRIIKDTKERKMNHRGSKAMTDFKTLQSEIDELPEETRDEMRDNAESILRASANIGKFTEGKKFLSLKR